ncbi:MAG: dipeptidyl aminopeptidase/acylaminoacyl peptidase, partial [Flavobacteriales bacterium]
MRQSLLFIKNNVFFYILICMCSFSCLFAQKQIMTPAVYDQWYQIRNAQISNDGRWVVYEEAREQMDGRLKIHDTKTDRQVKVDRANKAYLSEDSRYLACFIYPSRDSIRELKRRKVKEEDLPGDTLLIYDLAQNKTTRIPDVKDFKMPKHWDDWLIYQMEPYDNKDSLVLNAGPGQPSIKVESKKSGSKLVLHELATGKEIIYPFVKEYAFSKKSKRVLFSSSGDESEFIPGIYLFDGEKKSLKPLFRYKGEYHKLSLSENGTQAAFIADLDTTDNRTRPYQLFYFEEGTSEEAALIGAAGDSFMPKDWNISSEYEPLFSPDGSKLFFGIKPLPFLPDTSLLEEEKVKVEIWGYQDSRLQTQQNVTLEEDKKKSYRSVWFPKTGQYQILEDQALPNSRIGDEGNADWVLVYTEEPYLRSMSWEGFPIPKDVYVINAKNKRKQLVANGLRGSPRLSTNGGFVYWYSYTDASWFCYNIAQSSILQLTDNNSTPFYNEQHDTPSLPGGYGIAGWGENDAFIYINDRYDIWKIDPQGKIPNKKLTNGRASKTVYRYLDLNKEERFIKNNETILLRLFQEDDKQSGYVHLNLKNGKVKKLATDAYQFSRQPFKARDKNTIVYTKENFQTFPDLYYFNNKIKRSKRISNTNPQQKDYKWGSISLYEWTDKNGRQHTGMLAKPANIDPDKKYPMIVNFYERSSDRLHGHRAPYPHRSTINYSLYTNQGYWIFNPDILYTEGNPGDDALDIVVSGVESLLENSTPIDKDRIGLQGHSWGGYQVAHIITKTDLFACAESGAPVVNMFSAYGGIRWRSGLSRMFQYEHTQSRIGATIWERPDLYKKNSPLFNLDKVNTPVLILHNDKDGAVPWYQGIEFFVAMRRLNKPAWLLNYNGEPHWPVKRQNRIDFQNRMLAFFDHYLKEKPM